MSRMPSSMAAAARSRLGLASGFSSRMSAPSLRLSHRCYHRMAPRATRKSFSPPLEPRGKSKSISASRSKRADGQLGLRAKAVTAVRRRKLGALILEEKPLANPTSTSRRRMLDGIRDMGLASLPGALPPIPSAPASRFCESSSPKRTGPISRIQLCSPRSTTGSLPISRHHSQAHLERLDWVANSSKPGPPRSRPAVWRSSPHSLEVPSGADVRIDYETEGDPSLACACRKCSASPAHPQSPMPRAPPHRAFVARRTPLAVTPVARTFWTNGYPSVAPTCAAAPQTRPGPKTR